MITGINHITVSAKNLDESFSFYTQILKFKPLLKWERGAYLLAGDFWFCVALDINHTSNKQKGHIAFSTTLEFLAEIKQLIHAKKIVEWTENTSEGESIYILDPSGNQLELHIGSWETRLKSIQQTPYKGHIEFFES